MCLKHVDNIDKTLILRRWTIRFTLGTMGKALGEKQYKNVRYKELTGQGHRWGGYSQSNLIKC